MRQTFFLHRLRAPFGAPVLSAVILFWLSAALPRPSWAGDLSVPLVLVADMASAREAVVEVIESRGLVVNGVLPVGRMLERTAGDLGKTGGSPVNAEIIQFCSARLAWRLVEEDPAQIALCPFSIVLYAVGREAGKVFLSYRSPGRQTAARRDAEDLLQDIAPQAARLAVTGGFSER